MNKAIFVGENSRSLQRRTHTNYRTVDIRIWQACSVVFPRSRLLLFLERELANEEDEDEDEDED